MQTILQDLRYGIRTLAKSPGFVMVAVVTLALGIGANTAIFSIVDSLLLRPLPVKDPQQITVLAFQQKDGPLRSVFSIPDYRDIQNQTQGTFSGVIGYQLGLDGLSVDGKGDRIESAYVTGNFFSVLGIKPTIGRLILPSEGENPGADPVIVLSYAYWKTRFASDPGTIGKRVSLNGHPMTIIGVAPPEFDGVNSLISFQAFLPLAMAAAVERFPQNFMANRGSRSLNVLGRLQPKMSLTQTQSSLAVVGQRLSQQYPDTDKEVKLRAIPELRSRLGPDEQDTVPLISGLFLGLAALVLLLACMNVANILLVRATIRRREMAIRAALGAGPIRLVRQLLTESLGLALFGGAAGILIGMLGIVKLSSIGFQSALHFRLDLHLDWRVFSYAFVAALLTGITLGMFPAIRASRGNLNAILHGGGLGVVGGGQRLRSALASAQVGGSLMLLIIAGLFTRSLREAQRVSLGFEPNHVLNLAMDPNEIGYNQAQTVQFYQILLDRVRALPGVESAGTASSIPMGPENRPLEPLSIDGYQPPTGEPGPVAPVVAVSSDYFKTMGIPLALGRTFTAADDGPRAQSVAIVNEAMAKRFWPDRHAVGLHFHITGFPSSYQVVGVVRDFRYQGMTGSVQPQFYVPFASTGFSLETLQLRTTAAPEEMIPEIEHVIETMAPGLPVFNVQTMTRALDTLGGLLMFRLGAVLAATLGILGLTLAAVGVYGVISCAASQRTREIGVRMALGARPMGIMQMILRQGMLTVGLGLIMGLAVSFPVARLVGRFLIVSALDSATYFAVTALLTVVAFAACYIPARRAIRVDPMAALRHE